MLPLNALVFKTLKAILYKTGRNWRKNTPQKLFIIKNYEMKSHLKSSEYFEFFQNLKKINERRISTFLWYTLFLKNLLFWIDQIALSVGGIKYTVCISVEE